MIPAHFLPETAILICQDLDITPLAPEKVSDYALLRQWLTQYIGDLMQNNPDYLRWALYRLDIDQNKATAAFEQAKRWDTALILADLIIERECQKAQTRQWYKEKMKNDDKNNKANDTEYADRW